MKGDKKKFLLIGNYFFPELTGIGKYNGEMIDWLSKNGYQCTAVVPYPYSPYWRIHSTNYYRSYWYKKELKKMDHSAPAIIYRCPHFVPSIPTGLKRVISDLSFVISSLCQVIYLMAFRKYDYVIVISPCFLLVFSGLLIRLFKNTKFIYHIQDLQVDTAHELGMIRWKPFIKLMFRCELAILKNADYVSSISDGMIKKIKQKYDRPVILFPNWVNTDIIYPVKEKISIKNKLNLPLDRKIVLYSGAIGEKQGLKDLLDVASNLHFRKDINFIICSSGPYFNKLKKTVQDLKLDNISFIHLLPIEKYNELLNIADIHLVLQRSNANDLVMPSKLTSILSAGGLAIVTATATTSLHNLISNHKIGYIIEQENVKALTTSIVEIIDNDPIEIKKNAREFALKYLDINIVISNFLSQVMSVS